jgi:magnesium-transporting ATPase (P-type)
MTTVQAMPSRGRGTVEPKRAAPGTSRSYTSIALANVFTVFNVILVGFGVVTFVFGDPEDALFLGIVLVNAGIGIVQEVRAKAALDRLAAHAGRITATARTFRHPASPLERALNRLLFILVGVMLPLGVMLIYALWRRRIELGDAVTIATAAIVPLVPEGLVLLTRLTYAVATLRMARHGVLAQQLNAVESLASTQVVCLDKTGTLTEPALRLVETIPAPGV